MDPDDPEAVLPAVAVVEDPELDSSARSLRRWSEAVIALVAPYAAFALAEACTRRV
ncbi:hypothetical protein ACFV30_14540 [Streptomyces sp. NPDC059752]|uniref:hypothetical protein n=1 Tax=unclassified Streptomyces TaxID=2593676 RepID=UPI0036511F03